MLIKNPYLLSQAFSQNSLDDKDLLSIDKLLIKVKNGVNIYSNPNLRFLSELDNWSDKYEAIMELGLKLKPLAYKQKNNTNKVLGCQSRVWINTHIINNKLHINGEADSRLVQGLIAIVAEIYNQMTIEQYQNLTPKFDNQWLSTLELNSKLSMVRKSGLSSILNKTHNQLKTILETAQ